jgi:hypothetical protein
VFLLFVKEFLSILSLPAADNRGQYLKFTTLGERADSVDHLLHSLCCYFIAALKTGGAPDPGEEETEVIVNLRDGTDRRPGVVAAALLLD